MRKVKRVSKAKAALGDAAQSSKKRKSAQKPDCTNGDANGEDAVNPTISERENSKDKKKEVGHVEPNDSDWSGEEESFEVEAVLSSRARHGKRQFKIRWKGYGPEDDTWEDEENVDSPELISAFLRGTPESETGNQKLKKPAGKKQAKKRTGPASPKSKPAKKAKSEDDSDENTEWEVSKIVDYVNLKDGTKQFLVQWKGFSSKQNTWEPESNLNCPELIKKFLELEKKREENTRETREVRQQVLKYNPELTKRSSRRSSSVKRISYRDLE